MSGDDDDFWSALPDKALHPVRVPVVEAFYWIGEPLSALGLVDVLDGDMTMWDAAYHLQVLEALDLVEPVAAGTGEKTSKRGVFDVAYRLKGAAR